MKRRRPPVPITSPAFVWTPPDADSNAFWQRQQERIARVQAKPAATVAQIRRKA